MEKWLGKQYPGRDKKRGTARQLMLITEEAVPKKFILKEFTVVDKAPKK